jgi:flagellar hook-associated protein 2
MRSSSQHYKDSLSELGITVNKDATLSIDEDKLSKTISELKEDQDPAELIKGFAQSTLRKVNQIQLNPMDYVDKRIVAYKNPSTEHFANPYVTSAYSGMLFNGYM